MALHQTPKSSRTGIRRSSGDQSSERPTSCNAWIFVHVKRRRWVGHADARHAALVVANSARHRVSSPRLAGAKPIQISGKTPNVVDPHS